MKKYLDMMSAKIKAKCIFVIALAFVSSLLASVWPVRLGELYTSISNGTLGSIGQGVTAIAQFGLIYLSAECITIARRVLLDCIIADHEAEIRERSTEKLLKMPVSYYSECPSGEKTAQLNQGVAGFSQLIKIMCNDVFATGLTAVCTLMQVFLNAPGLVVGIMLLYLVCTVAISAFQIRSQNGIRERIVSKKNALDGQICQSISNLELIRGMNAECYERRRLQPDIQSISRTEQKHHRYMGAFDCMKQFCKIAFQVILLIVSVALISSGRMPTGAVITVCLLFQQLVRPIDEVYRFMDETASSVVKAKALLEVISSAPDEIFAISSTGEGTSVSTICLKNVLVTNPEKSKGLALYQNVVIPCDRRIALQGPTGSGKTTMIRCLNRYYPHTEGKVTLFGRSLDTYSQKELTSLLYYVPQSAFFFAGTVRDNLVYGLEGEFSDKELCESLRKACLVGGLEGMLCENPAQALGYMLSEGAKNLSGGQKQRLALARAFLRSPKMYVFDESTANLDESMTDMVLNNIETHAKAVGAGIMYISHDRRVMDRCDEIIVLKNQIAKGTAGKEAA